MSCPSPALVVDFLVYNAKALTSCPVAMSRQHVHFQVCHLQRNHVSFPQTKPGSTALHLRSHLPDPGFISRLFLGLTAPTVIHSAWPCLHCARSLRSPCQSYIMHACRPTGEDIQDGEAQICCAAGSKQPLSKQHGSQLQPQSSRSARLLLCPSCWKGTELALPLFARGCEGCIACSQRLPVICGPS